ncbi:MAG: hypothetical protein ACFHHU_13440 [Porticoccaceae bacterium]
MSSVLYQQVPAPRRETLGTGKGWPYDRLKTAARFGTNKFGKLFFQMVMVFLMAADQVCRHLSQYRGFGGGMTASCNRG